MEASNRTFLAGLLFDFRYAARTLLKNPGFAATAVLALALGMGAGTAVFTVANSVLLRPLAYRDADRLVRILASNDEMGFSGAGLAPGDFMDFRSRSRTLEELSAYVGTTVNLSGEDRPEVVPAAAVSPSLFSLLGFSAAAGRVLLPEEEVSGRDKVVVVSHRFWQRRLGGEDGVAGRIIRLDGEEYEVVGAMPAGFGFPSAATDLWVPLAFAPESLSRRSHYLGAVARLAPGVSMRQAREELDSLSRALEEEHPDSNAGWRAAVIELHELVVGRVRPALAALSVAVVFVLLIACSNVANLLLARSASRRKEAAVRAALGATRMRLTRMFLAESTLLALLGGAVGFGLALWAVRALVAASPGILPRSSEIAVDYTAFFFSLALALLAGLAFGTLPALQTSRCNLDLALKSEGASGKGASGRSRAASLLIVLELALAMALLAGAGLMFKGFHRLRQVDPGFQPGNALAMQIQLPGSKYPGDPDRVGFFEAVIERLGSLPGVVSVGASSAIPLHPFGQNALPFRIEGSPGTESAEGVFAAFSAVTPGYFGAMGIPLLQGKGFNQHDSANGPPVVVINRTMARRFWGGADPIGERLAMTVRGSQPVSYEIVGIVGETRNRRLEAEPEPAIHVPFRQIPHGRMIVVLRAERDALSLAETARRQVYLVDPEQPVHRTMSLERLLDNSTSRTRFYTALLLAFAGLGLALAAVGVYGLISYSVSRRAKEMAIRMAIGASRGRILRLVAGQGLKLAAAGIAFGLIASWGLTRFLSGLLYGVSTSDPFVFTAVPLFLGFVALLASYLPAHRVARADPLASLRRE